MNVWTYLSIHSFSLYVPHIWKEDIEDTIEICRFNLQSRGAYHLTEKSGWGVESIMVSDLPVYRRIATSVTV